MLCAPIPHSLCSNSLLRTHDAINGMTLEQLRTGILQGCLFGRVAAPYVALIDFTMHHPFGHCPSWAAHEANAIFHDSSKRKKIVTNNNYRNRESRTNRDDRGGLGLAIPESIPPCSLERRPRGSTPTP